MTKSAPLPVHRVFQALDALAYWTSPPPRRRPHMAPLSALDQMYAYWRPD